MLQALIEKNRSFRRFDETVEIKRSVLEGLVNLARLSASSANMQPLKYYLVNTAESNAQVFPLLRWAGYLKEWDGPEIGERPTAYIIILGDTRIKTNFGVDHGIAAQSIMLGAAEQGLGGCMIAFVQREALAKTLDIPSCYEILLVLALGKPIEKVFLEDVGTDGDIKYYRDAEGGHHVPKRMLKDLIIN